MTYQLTRLRAEIAEAEADRDAAQAAYDILAGPGERLLQAIAEHRAKSLELANAVDDDQYPTRLAEQHSLEREIETLRAQVDASAFHAARGALTAASGRLGELQQQYGELCWLTVPAACAHLFEQAEAARRAYEKSLIKIDSVAQFSAA